MDRTHWGQLLLDFRHFIRDLKKGHNFFPVQIIDPPFSFVAETDTDESYITTFFSISEF